MTEVRKHDLKALVLMMHLSDLCGWVFVPFGGPAGRDKSRLMMAATSKEW